MWASINIMLLCFWLGSYGPPEYFHLFGMKLSYMVNVSYNQVYSIWQSYTHILDCLLNCHVWLMWHFFYIVNNYLQLISSGYIFSNLWLMWGLISYIYQIHIDLELFIRFGGYMFLFTVLYMRGYHPMDIYSQIIFH